MQKIKSQTSELPSGQASLKEASILLTGATGFIGRNVAEELLKRGYKVFAISNSTLLPEMKNLVQIQLNLFEKESVEKFLEENRFEDLIHLAWYTGEKCHSSEVNLDWMALSLSLLKSFQKNGGKRVLFAGSMSEYDFSYGYLKEDLTPLKNPSLYGKCKSSLFEIASTFAKQTGMDFKWARVFNLYGPYEKPNRLMPYVICSILKKEEVRVSACTKTQDYLHVYDTANAIVKLFESEVQGAVNISSGIPIKLKVIVEKISELMNYKGKIFYGAIPTNFEDEFVVGCNDRLTQDVGWAQKYDLEEGLKQTIKWWRQNNV